MNFPGPVGLMLSADGRAVVELRTSSNMADLFLTDLDSGGERVLASGIGLFSMGTDLAHARLAVSIDLVDDAVSTELWAGRFPEPRSF